MEERVLRYARGSVMVVQLIHHPYPRSTRPSGTALAIPGATMATAISQQKRTIIAEAGLDHYRRDIK
jgi:hypothetical protein